VIQKNVKQKERKTSGDNQEKGKMLQFCATVGLVVPRLN